MGGGIEVIVQRRPPTPSAVFGTYWRLAAERQCIYELRVADAPPPWTDDPVLQEYRFTNPFRASDRVSQYLIGSVIYDGDQHFREVFFRTVLFRLFNRVSTWEALLARHGRLCVERFSVESFDRTLTSIAAEGARLYSAAYIMPPVAAFATGRKHRDHLRLVEHMLDEALPERLAAARDMREGFLLLRGCPGIGDFLAYQLVTDLSYSEALPFSEMEFVMPGPGARSGIRKCFSDYGDYSEADIVGWVAETQADQFSAHGAEPVTLWGRPLQLIDCQNLFCEVDKYARVAHPAVGGRGSRRRIKQRFAPAGPLPRPCFPPKWRINERLAHWLAALRDEVDLPALEVDQEAAAALRPDAAPGLIAGEDRVLPLR